MTPAVTVDDVAEVAEKKVARLQASIDFLLETAADKLRDSVAEFNRLPPSLGSIDVFRERVLWIADRLADGVVEGRLVELPGSGESRRVEPA